MLVYQRVNYSYRDPHKTGFQMSNPSDGLRGCRQKSQLLIDRVNHALDIPGDIAAGRYLRLQWWLGLSLFSPSNLPWIWGESGHFWATTKYHNSWFYICIYVYMYICIYVYMSICIYVYMSICIYIYVYVYMYICLYVYMYICIYVYMYICIYVYMYVCMCIYVYMYICIYKYIYMYMSICIYICICLYVYMYICI